MWLSLGITNAIRNQKHFKPIANVNVADNGMIALTDEPLRRWKAKEEWKFNWKSWIKKLINYCFSQNITKHKLRGSLLNVSMLFPFSSLKGPWKIFGKLTGYFYNHINKKGYFYSHENITSYGIPLLATLFIPHYQKTWKVQCKSRQVNVIH